MRPGGLLHEGAVAKIGDESAYVTEAFTTDNQLRAGGTHVLITWSVDAPASNGHDDVTRPSRRFCWVGRIPTS
jgi:hypothetical protein